MLIKRVRAGTEYAIGEEQCGYMLGKGCIDQVLEKYLVENDVFWALIDLEKAYMIRSIVMVCGRC